jgi:7,8-dihydropterin-6-yl-methyl-4-(beta-D-ribofuranosyl)aminobenzene 5'-phosphate synthase
MKRQVLFTTILLIMFFSSGSNQKTEKKSSSVTDYETENREIVINSVFDNYLVKPGLRTSWGLACVIETTSEKILFDTGGDSEILLYNMRKMKIDPKSIDKVIISHEDWDHVGGLEGFLEVNNVVKVFIPSSFSKKTKNMILDKGATFEEVSDTKKIAEFIYSTGVLTGPPDEQSLMLETNRGLVVLTGCAHPGIVRILKRAKDIADKDRIYLVAGGFHHPPLSVIKEFREINVEKVAPSHCTGDRVREAFKDEYKEDFIEYGVGCRVEIK